MSDHNPECVSECLLLRVFPVSIIVRDAATFLHFNLSAADISARPLEARTHATTHAYHLSSSTPSLADIIFRRCRRCSDALYASTYHSVFFGLVSRDDIIVWTVDNVYFPRLPPQVHYTVGRTDRPYVWETARQSQVITAEMRSSSTVRRRSLIHP